MTAENIRSDGVWERTSVGVIPLDNGAILTWIIIYCSQCFHNSIEFNEISKKNEEKKHESQHTYYVRVLYSQSTRQTQSESDFQQMLLLARTLCFDLKLCKNFGA